MRLRLRARNAGDAPLIQSAWLARSAPLTSLPAVRKSGLGMEWEERCSFGNAGLLFISFDEVDEDKSKTEAGLQITLNCFIFYFFQFIFFSLSLFFFSFQKEGEKRYELGVQIRRMIKATVVL